MTHSLQVAAISGALNTPSSRFRVQQMIAPLAQEGIAVIHRPALASNYPPPQRWLRPFWGTATVIGRVPGVLASWKADLTWLSREMVSTLVTLEPFTKCPRVFEADDAIWLYREGRAARFLARHSDAIIAGNEFLADWFSQYNEDVTIIPTAVNTERFKPLGRIRESEQVIIGWSGSSSNFKYLYTIEPALEKVLAKHPTAQLRIVADQKPKFRQINPTRIEFIPWSPQNEVNTIQEMDIGIMPLEDSDWTRGKCSYKMLLYMACAVPVVVSPVGMNATVLQTGTVGVPAQTLSDWQGALNYLIDSPDIRHRFGTQGRQVCLAHYSLAAIAPRLAKCLKRVAGYP